MQSTTVPSTTIPVLLSLGVFNFIASIIQGVAGIGDAIFMQVLWFLACGLWPESFLNTPLGTEPVRAVALIMYIRLLFMSPLVVYLGLNDSIFSKTMTIMMAVPSTILSIIGVLLFKKLNADALKKVLGITSFFFALVYVCIIVYRKWRKTRQVEELKSRHVKLVVEADAIAEEAQRSHNTSMVNLHASFVQNVPNNSIFMQPPPSLTGPPGAQLSHLNMSFPMIQPSMPSLPTIGSNEHTAIDVPGTTVLAQNTQEPTIDARTGLPADTTEAFLSTIGGEVFVAPETQEPQLNEENVPPLTPSKISPSRTMTYTRVRINRNIDANGKVKMSTKIGAAVAASIAGIMASLTGVNAPPQIIFILLYDAPNYIVRVNFSAQSIPSNIVRFFMAVAQGSFAWNMAPLLIDVIIFGFAGVFVGNKIGRLLGPQSFNIFVLCLLLLCALAMMGRYLKLLIISTILTVVITIVCGYLENKRNKPLIEKQRLSELEVEKRLYDCLEELQRSNNSFVASANAATSPTASLEHMQRATRPKPMWGGANYDNDDDSNNGDKHGEVDGDAPAAPANGVGQNAEKDATAAAEEAGDGAGPASAPHKALEEETLDAAAAAVPEKEAPALPPRSTHPQSAAAPLAVPAAKTQHPALPSQVRAEEEDELDAHTVPAVMNDGSRGTIDSVHSSDETTVSSADHPTAPPSATGAAANAAAGRDSRATEQQAPYNREHQSPSLHSLNSDLQ